MTRTVVFKIVERRIGTMKKLYFTQEAVKECFVNAIENQNKAEFKRLYFAAMKPVKRFGYKRENMYLQDLEWDLNAKLKMFKFLALP